jgi:hypothetical protein
VDEAAEARGVVGFVEAGGEARGEEEGGED